MNRNLRFATCLLLATSSRALFATPADDVTAAAKKLGDQANYSWTATSVSASGGFTPGPVNGKTEKGGATYVTSSFGDNSMEVVLQGDKGAVKGQDGWQSLAEADQAEGPGRFIGVIARNTKIPAPNAVDLAAHTAQAAPGERALLRCPTGIDFMTGFLGCLMAGVIAVPMMLPRRQSARDASVSIVADCTPRLALAPATPASVKANEHYILAGTITDDAEFLGTKNRMRVWFSSGAPPAANYDGAQTSTVIVTSQGDTIAFTFELTAPKDPTTLYFQLGEVSPDFARKDGSQAAFLVLPDLSLGAKPLTLQVTPAGATAVAAVSKN